eukprot:GGOE01040586.1.p1 GENE.GGOE01040586.1~~GGOE01040586.1.p1  ORF type:complete len:172 (-),score=57.25 GGOE01040586.1:198-713(-)
MEEHFRDMAGVKSYVSFSNLTEDQEECAEIAAKHIPEMKKNKFRDRHLKMLKLMLTGYLQEDIEEHMKEDHFSQSRFLDIYTHTVSLADKFDFLMECVAHKVCRVAPQYAEDFVDLIKEATKLVELTYIPEEVVNQDQRAREDDEARRDAFCTKAEWSRMKAQQAAATPHT